MTYLSGLAEILRDVFYCWLICYLFYKFTDVSCTMRLMGKVLLVGLGCWLSNVNSCCSFSGNDWVNLSEYHTDWTQGSTNFCKLLQSWRQLLKLFGEISFGGFVWSKRPGAKESGSSWLFPVHSIKRPFYCSNLIGLTAMFALFPHVVPRIQLFPSCHCVIALTLYLTLHCHLVSLSSCQRIRLMHYLLVSTL